MLQPVENLSATEEKLFSDNLSHSKSNLKLFLDYLELVASLNFLSKCTQPDIFWSSHFLSRLFESPKLGSITHFKESSVI